MQDGDVASLLYCIPHDVQPTDWLLSQGLVRLLGAFRSARTIPDGALLRKHSQGCSFRGPIASFHGVMICSLRRPTPCSYMLP